MRKIGLLTTTLLCVSLVIGIETAAAENPAEQSRRTATCGSCLPVDSLAPDQSAIYVAAIQAALTERGYRAGPRDGLFGRRTRDAIIRYQRDADLKIDGQPSAALLDHLRYARHRPSPDSDSLASSDTRWLQSALVSQGYDAGPLDGLRGPRTRQAVAEFQNELKLPTTGKADPMTVRALQEHLASPSERTRPTDLQLTWQEPGT
jgi:peptidoglycan hydrolase-like protein with peptidoglycan-binding domain